MELRDFIKGVLYDITLGIKESQEQLKDVGVKISPDLIKNTQGPTCINEPLHYVDFDIAVEVTKNIKGDAGVGVVSVLSLGTKIESKESNNSLSRVKFSIPIVYPIQR